MKNIIIGGPSGSGKTSVIEGLLENPLFELSVSYTTRDPRPGEIEGKEYHFVSQEEFEVLKNKDFFYEYEEIFGNLYGTPKSNNKKITIYNLGIEGVKKMKILDPESIFIFIFPPSLSELKKRLEKRSRQCSKRIEYFELELQNYKYFDYFIVNNDLQVAINQVIFVINVHNNNIEGIKIINSMIKDFRN